MPPFPSRLARVLQSPTVETRAGLVIWAVAAAVTARGQVLASTSAKDAAVVWLIFGTLVGVVAIKLLEPTTKVPTVSRVLETNVAPGHAARRVGLVLIALGAVGVAGATVVTAKGIDPAANLLWLDGILAVFLGVLLFEGRKRRGPFRLTRQTALGAALLLAIILLALGLRLWELSLIPADVHGDEAAMGIQARQIMSGAAPVAFGLGWNSFSDLSFASRAATLRIFGDDLFGLRMASVLEGVASIVVLFLFARRLWGTRVGLLAAALMTVSAWHIWFSRSGLQNIQALLVVLLVLYFLVRAVQEGRLTDWLLCGLALGWSVETYFGARIVAAVVCVYLAYRAITDRAFLRNAASGLLVMVAGAALFLAPFGAIYLKNPALLGERNQVVFVATPFNLEHELSAYHVTSLQQVLTIQAVRTLEAFNILGETSQQYGHPGPLFDPWTGGLLAMGAVAFLVRISSAERALLGSWVWITLIVGSVLTVDALFSPRVVAVIPALVVVAALTLEYAWRGLGTLFGRWGTYAFTVPVIAVLGLALQANIHDTFEVQPVELMPAGSFTVLARYVQSINDQYRTYVLGRPDYTLTYDTPRFLVPNADAVNVRDQPLQLPLETIPATKGLAFIVQAGNPDSMERLQSIEAAYPGGSEQLVYIRPNALAFTSYLVTHSDAQAANPAASQN